MKKVTNTHLKVDVSDIYLLAVHSTAPAFHLAWCINDAFSFDLSLSNKPFELFMTKDDQNSIHRVWYFESEPGMNELFMVENMGTLSILTPGKPPADFFIAFKGEPNPGIINLMVSGLKGMKHVNFAYFVDRKVTEKIHWLMGLEECRPGKVNED